MKKLILAIALTAAMSSAFAIAGHSSQDVGVADPGPSMVPPCWVAITNKLAVDGRRIIGFEWHDEDEVEVFVAGKAYEGSTGEHISLSKGYTALAYIADIEAKIAACYKK
jgi:hypothetical protein